MACPLPLIGDIPFKDVLVVENRIADIKPLLDDLEKNGFSVEVAETSEKAEAKLANRPDFDIIILDWILDEVTDIEAKALLKSMRRRYFAPVIIYSDKGVEGPSHFLKEENLDRIGIVLDKNTIRGEKVIENVKNWLEHNPEIKILLRWAAEIDRRKNHVLWEVHDLEVGGMRALIDVLKYKQPDVSYLSREKDVVFFLEKVLKRKMSDNEPFFETIERYIKELLTEKKAEELNVEKLRAFHHFERYRPPITNSIWTGDIIKNEQDEYFIIVTPICDLCNQNKVEDILLLKVEPLKSFRERRKMGKTKTMEFLNEKNYSLHYLPYAAGLPDGLVCKFDQILSVKIPDLKKQISEGKMTCIETVDSPFIENLIQRLNSYLMRLGVRTLSKIEITKIVEDSDFNK